MPSGGHQMRSSPAPVASGIVRVVAAFGLVVATIGCSAAPETMPTPDPVKPSARPSAAASPAAVPSASVAPPPSGPPSAAPIDPAPAEWSEPRAVGSSGQCQAISAVIDTVGRNHLAAACDGRIRYSVEVGTDWDTSDFAPPDKREEHDPQLAFDGDVLYLAYTRISIGEGGCGDDGLRDDGVYVRSKTLPDGPWSEPRQVGEVADHVQSFRVVAGTIHATVANEDDERIYYETLRGESFQRYEIPNATGEAALRIGDDGKARIAYEAGGALWYAVVTGPGFSAEKVPGSGMGFRPVLVLGAGDRPHLVWTRGYHSGGCTEPDPAPEHGTYYSTQVAGAWQSEQLTTAQGVASLTLDTDANRVHALVDDPDGVVYLSRSGARSWARRTLADLHAGDAVLRLDPRSGELLAAYIVYENDSQRIYVQAFR